jgi:hypothetical protein
MRACAVIVVIRNGFFGTLFVAIALDNSGANLGRPNCGARNCWGLE